MGGLKTVINFSIIFKFTNAVSKFLKFIHSEITVHFEFQPFHSPLHLSLSFPNRVVPPNPAVDPVAGFRVSKSFFLFCFFVLHFGALDNDRQSSFYAGKTRDS